MAIETRRTQQQRREETRVRLLEATIASLLDGGWAGTTTRRVCELSGVSQGAQSYHFPTRVDLVGAAVEHMAVRRLAELDELTGDLPSGQRERIAALLDLLYADYSSPFFHVFVKLWVAAADDPELYARLVPIERKIAEATRALTTKVAGDAFLSQPGWENRLRLSLATFRGLALSEGFEPRGGRRRDAWPDLRALLIDEFDQLLS